MSSNPDMEAGREQGRLAGLVIALTGVAWVAATWAGDHWDWTQRTRALFDLAALAGFAFAMVVTYRIWRARRKDEG
ncbi:MAG: DUF5337 domain-containing protein [Maritimibacter sp.]|jgi:hypothetical protein